MKFFPSLCNCYYQSRDTRGDQRRVVVILTSMSIAAASVSEASDHPRNGTRHHRPRRRSVTAMTSSRASRNGRYFADHQLSPASPSPSVPSSSFDKFPRLKTRSNTDQLGLLLNETAERMRVFPFYSAQSVASLDTFLARFRRIHT